MPSRLAGILACLLLANVANYALGEWLEAKLPAMSTLALETDGSSLLTSRFYQEVGVVNDADPSRLALLKFYRYLDRGGAEAYYGWRAVATAPGDQGLLPTALSTAEATNSVRAVSLLTLFVIVCCLYGRLLRDESWLTPVLHFAVGLVTTALFAAFLSPLSVALYAICFTTYFGACFLLLPILRTEWTRSMRPLLTWYIFLLATMVFRGQELIDWWFWTSPLYRLGLVFVALLAIFFHLNFIDRALRAADMSRMTRVFAYGFPLGTVLTVVGLFMGLYGADAGAGLRTLNEQLAVLPKETVAAINPDAPFALFFAGATILIVAGIGYSIQRIAR